ncbi:antibiotic biosynthesis monooxygenase family protein [Bacillus sp. B1-b2]|uniref:antibiotic biosynthesis monooxygenase family protein n=1 Tax=Bacillus sp. B1-b2 TaxID=2653201 RepID=UPI00126249D8|nr:antibiotic biosynthesis monooxygenase [Bacillus sp. B1-b2]KAB7665367.1 antibiotic biosynthesis monooxygenase [Bacillus sp. B1-b2]
MNIYLTSGTYDYLFKKYEKNILEETMLLMQESESDRAILLHESSSSSLFQEPRAFEVIFSYGALINNGYITMNHIPISDEHKPTFEYSLKEYLKGIEERNMAAIRLLSPKKGDTYILLCLWKDKQDYISWKQLPHHANAPIGKSTEYTWNSFQHSLFNGKPYYTSLFIPEKK